MQKLDKPVKPILIAGPTAAGKSALALHLAQAFDGVVINADALQVYDCWRILTARPGDDDLAMAPHRLYGHVACDQNYSVGHWLTDVGNILDSIDKTPIIIGGTGLYFTALTTGLADIPAMTPKTRAAGDALRHAGTDVLRKALEQIDPKTLATLDQNNPMRLQRAWEVVSQTGTPLLDWQINTPPPILALAGCKYAVLNVNVNKLNNNIDLRFDLMLKNGVMNEVSAVIKTGWKPALPASRALGARELVAVSNGSMSMDDAVAAAKLATRQYAKRQRSWFRNRMGDWPQLPFDTKQDQAKAFAFLAPR